MGLFKNIIDGLSGGGKKPLYSLDETPPETPPASPLQPESPPQKVSGEIIPPDVEMPAGATVTKKVVIDGREVTDPAEIARVEKMMTSGFGMLGMMEQLRQGAHKIETSVSYSSSSQSSMSREDMLKKISDLTGKMPAGAHSVEYVSKKAWRDGKEITDPDAVENILKETLKRTED